MQKRWQIKPTDEKKATELQEALKVHPVICRLLVQRGIETYEDARLFFRPELAHLHDPFLMKDMDKAVERMKQAIAREEKILVYGDYDVDGTTSVSLVYSFLKEFYHHVDYYIPNRYSEGYGISFQGVDFAKEQGFGLVIALDCGIKAQDKIDYANELGIDFIICDHHTPGDTIPRAVAVLDPKRGDCQYPYKELSGCGIGFKLIHAFAKEHDMPFETVTEYLDLVAVSIAADIVPMTGENRVLAYFGVNKINTNPRSGIKALIESNNLKKELTISDLVFILGPRINAAGRMDDAKKAVTLLISNTTEHANGNVGVLNKKNNERKEVDSTITQEAINLLMNNPEEAERKTTVLFQSHWHKGVIGIVASRLMDTYYRPTIVLTESMGYVTGSARSVRDFDIYNAIKSCSDLLEQFGGHMYAAGLTLKPENLEAFRMKFEEVVSASIDERLLVPEIPIDAELNFDDVNFKFYNIIKQFAPFGPGNMRPVFLTKGVHDTGSSRVVGENHLQLHVKQNGSKTLKGIAYSMGDWAKEICKNGQHAPSLDVCYCLSENEWQGRKSIELSVKDIKKAPL